MVQQLPNVSLNNVLLVQSWQHCHNVIDCTVGPDVVCCSITGFQLFPVIPQLLLSPPAVAEEEETAAEAK